MYRWRSKAKNGQQILGTGKTKVGQDRPGIVRAKGRPLNSIDKSVQPRSVRIPKYKEKADMIKAVILNFAENRKVTLTFEKNEFSQSLTLV